MKNQKKLASWVCAKCGVNLPTQGLVWRSRYSQSKEHRETHSNSGYLCDRCANDREDW